MSSNATQYNENFTYDENGNIKSLNRNSSTGAIDNLTYYYYTKTCGTYIPGAGSPVGPTNKLARVTDGVGAPVGTNIGNQTSTTNYTYDENGNLISDASEQIASIEWTIARKVKRIIRSTPTSKKNIEYKYDGSGNRISKRLYTGTTTQVDYQTTYYVRDAEGNIMATYEKDYQTLAPNISLKLKELDLYGSDRIGNITTNDLLVQSQTAGPPLVELTQIKSRVLGTKNYELVNHLGNVLAVVSDRKISVDNTGDGKADFFMPDLLSTTDYYTFGQEMSGRKWELSTYRYGMNTQEKDDEIFKGAYGAKFWEYDSRIGRRWNTDPVVKDDESPYACFGGNAILNADPLGDDWGDVIAGLLIGAVTNVLPNSTSLRDKYNPTDAIDYNNALKGVDNAAMVGGAGMVLMGGAKATGGLVAAAAGAPVAGVGAAPGLVVAGVGVIEMGAGVVLTVNGANNKKAGYEYGEQKSGTSSPPGRAGTTIAKKNGVTVKSHGTNDAHKPAHAHVQGGGKEVRIGPNGKPLKNEPQLSTKQTKVVKEFKKQIRKELIKVGKANQALEKAQKIKT